MKRDPLGQPREVQATREDGAQETSLYYYNADISLERVQQPDGKVLDLIYDKRLRVTSLVRPTGSAQTMTPMNAPRISMTCPPGCPSARLPKRRVVPRMYSWITIDR